VVVTCRKADLIEPVTGTTPLLSITPAYPIGELKQSNGFFLRVSAFDVYWVNQSTWCPDIRTGLHTRALFVVLTVSAPLNNSIALLPDQRTKMQFRHAR
jgi:hypothetical protein